MELKPIHVQCDAEIDCVVSLTLRLWVKSALPTGHCSARIPIHSPPCTHSILQELLSSKEEREKLFEDISKYAADKKENRIELKGKISLKRLVAYFKNNENALYPGFQVNVNILHEVSEWVYGYMGIWVYGYMGIWVYGYMVWVSSGQCGGT
jgi:hypothetical protein